LIKGDISKLEMNMHFFSFITIVILG